MSNSKESGITFLDDNDVVLGRGAAPLKHPGNAAYRKLVSLNKALYVTAPKVDKLCISKSIVAAIREANGRFLEREDGKFSVSLREKNPDGSPVKWRDIGDRRAIEKTSQSLREGQSKLLKKLKQQDTSVRAGANNPMLMPSLPHAGPLRRISNKSHIETNPSVINSHITESIHATDCLDSQYGNGMKSENAVTDMHESLNKVLTIIQLNPAQTQSLHYPIGCNVWTQVDGSLRSGIVSGVHLNVTTFDVIYEVSIQGSNCFGGSSVELREDELSYATGCPVLYTPTGSFEDAVFKGKVLLRQKIKNGPEFLYSLMIFVDERLCAFDVIDDVPSTRIKYHNIVENRSSFKGGAI